MGKFNEEGETTKSEKNAQVRINAERDRFIPLLEEAFRPETVHILSPDFRKTVKICASEQTGERQRKSDPYRL